MAGSRQIVYVRNPDLALAASQCVNVVVILTLAGVADLGLYH